MKRIIEPIGKEFDQNGIPNFNLVNIIRPIDQHSTPDHDE